MLSVICMLASVFPLLLIFAPDGFVAGSSDLIIEERPLMSALIVIAFMAFWAWQLWFFSRHEVKKLFDRRVIFDS